MKAYITIKSHHTLDGNTEENELISVGTYDYSPEKSVLGYDEPSENGYEGSYTTLEIYSDRMVDLVRNGGSGAELVIEPGKCHYCQYGTPYGMLNICVSSKYIKNNLTPEGGTVEAEYNISFNACSIGDFLLEIKVRPER